MHCACLAQCYPPLAAFFTLLEEHHRSGEPQAGELAGGGGGKMPPVVAQMLALVEALSAFSSGLWESDCEIVDGGFVK